MTLKQLSIDSFILILNSMRVIINPLCKLSDLGNNDLVLLSLQKNDDYSSLSLPKLIYGAGEFEINSIFIYGVKNKNLNTYNYLINFNNLSIGIIHGVNNINLVNDSIFTDVDFLLIGAGNGIETLHPRDADNLSDKLSPVVTLFYGFVLDAVSDKFPVLENRFSLQEFKNFVEGAMPIKKSLGINDFNNYKLRSDLSNKLYFESYEKF